MFVRVGLSVDISVLIDKFLPTFHIQGEYAQPRVRVRAPKYNKKIKKIKKKYQNGYRRFTCLTIFGINGHTCHHWQKVKVVVTTDQRRYRGNVYIFSHLEKKEGRFSFLNMH